MLCRQHKLVALDISIHAPSRERLNSAGSVNPAAAFQSTLPRGSDTPCCLSKSKVSYFNPRSLAGATLLFYLLALYHFISIHAPLRERPCAYNSKQFRLAISIHAPLRERPSIQVLPNEQPQFQSTLPCGSDQPQLHRFVQRPGISIHAPLRERHCSQ